MSAIATLQSGFWMFSTYVSTQIPEPIISPYMLVGGTLISFVFAGMVNFHLSRSVAKLAVLGVSGTKISVTTYSFGGFLRKPLVADVAALVGGPKGASEKERQWTFGIQPTENGSVRYYVVDSKAGVLDEDAVRAICSTPRGGSLLTILAYKRQAGEMRTRWHDWQDRKTT
jgi:hypothetical protein